MTKEEAEAASPLMAEAREMLRKWEAGDKEVRALWEMMNNWVYAGFIAAQGCNVGKSLLEEGQKDVATDLVMEARVAGARLLTPIDAVVADAFSNEANTKIVDVENIEDDWI